LEQWHGLWLLSDKDDDVDSRCMASATEYSLHISLDYHIHCGGRMR